MLTKEAQILQGLWFGDREICQMVFLFFYSKKNPPKKKHLSMGQCKNNLSFNYLSTILHKNFMQNVDMIHLVVLAWMSRIAKLCLHQRRLWRQESSSLWNASNGSSQKRQPFLSDTATAQAHSFFSTLCLGSYACDGYDLYKNNDITLLKEQKTSAKRYKNRTWRERQAHSCTSDNKKKPESMNGWKKKRFIHTW